MLSDADDTFADRATCYLKTLDDPAVEVTAETKNYDSGHKYNFGRGYTPNLITSLSATALKAKLPSVFDGTVPVRKINDRQDHYPVIDMDVPCELIPSSQLGHSHLYINKSVPYGTYKNLLRALVDAGIVEEGYYLAFVHNGFTSARPIGTVKPGAEPTTAALLQEVAVLRHENAILRMRDEKISAIVSERGLAPAPEAITSTGKPLVAAVWDGFTEEEKTIWQSVGIQPYKDEEDF